VRYRTPKVDGYSSAGLQAVNLRPKISPNGPRSPVRELVALAGDRAGFAVTVLRLLCLGGFAAVLCAASSASADQIETVVVTASPPDPVGNGAFSVVKVTPAQLRAQPQLDAALKQVPGLSLFRRDSSVSANPTTQGVTLRSIAPSGAGRALVTLDGVPQNDPFGNWVIWSALPAEDLRGAEVVRGAGSGPLRF